MDVNTKYQSMAKKAGRPTDEPQTHQMQTRVSPQFLRKLDAWRKLQDDIPSRTEALRRLIDSHPEVEEAIRRVTAAGLEAEAQKKKGGRK